MMRAALQAGAQVSLSESGRWSLGQYRAVQKASEEAFGDEGESGVPFPSIEEHRKFKREYGKRQ